MTRLNLITGEQLLALRNTDSTPEKVEIDWDEYSEKLPGKLESKYGLGDRPGIRAKWYSYVADVVREYGEEARSLLNSVARSSRGKDDPGRYFCAALKNEFKRSGMEVIDQEADFDLAWYQR